MFRCKIINFLFSSIPLNKWKDFLIRRHIQECPVCQKRYVSALEAKSLLIEESEIESVPDFWLGLESRLAEPEKKKKTFLRPNLAWAAASIVILVVIAASIWLYLASISGKRAVSEKQADRFQINYVTVRNEPARTYLYCPYDSRMIIVWAERETL